MYLLTRGGDMSIFVTPGRAVSTAVCRQRDVVSICLSTGGEVVSIFVSHGRRGNVHVC